MPRSLLLRTALIPIVLSTAAALTVDGAQTTLPSPTLTVVAGIAMLESTQAPMVTYDAVQLEPEHAALIALFAVAAAPDHARPIIAAAMRSAPDRAAEIEAATTRALRRRPVPMTGIPDHAYLVRILERASAAALR